MATMFASLLLLAAYVCPASSTLYTSVTQLPVKTFDYIVIGAGAAGSVVASRLSENSKTTVLLLEAGISHEGIPEIQIPLLGPSLTPKTKYDWNYTTTAQVGYGGRKIDYPRGKLLGGSTSINLMVYTRGSADDWDRYANVSSDNGWSWESMRQYMEKNERFMAPPGGESTDGKYTPSEHSTTGMLSVCTPGFPIPLDDIVIDTTRSAEWPFNIDMNSGKVLGLGWAQATIGNGTRSSAATTYLAPEYLKRTNLHVLVNAQATKLIQTGTRNGVPSFHAVEFSANEGAKRSTVIAQREIVISAGSIGTPHLLQLSGIGNPVDLAAANIKTLVSLPDVGYNLSDHVLLTTHYEVTSNGTYDGLFRNSTLLDVSVSEWTATKTGPLANTVLNQLGWFRLPSNASIFDTESDPSSGPNSSHWELAFGNSYAAAAGGSVPAPTTGNFVTVFTNLISPTSRGVVKPVSPCPFVAPDINPNYLATPFDIFALIEAVKATKRLLLGSKDSRWADYIIGPYENITETDAGVEQYVRDNANSVWHPVGTASMSPKDANWGVVNPDLTVKETSGLRIVDASILPYAPNAHTQIPVYLVAERASDLIKAALLDPTLDDKIQIPLTS